MNQITLQDAINLASVFGLPLHKTITPSKIASQGVSNHVKSFALAYGNEVQLENIAMGLSLDFKVLGLNKNSETAREEFSNSIQILFQSLGYDALTHNTGSIHSVLPLLYSFDMKKEGSNYLPVNLQKILLVELQQVISTSKLSIDSLKSTFIDENPFNAIQPIKPLVDNFLLQSTIMPVEELKGFPKMWFHLRSLGYGFLLLLVLLLIFLVATVLPKGIVMLLNR